MSNDRIVNGFERIPTATGMDNYKSERTNMLCSRKAAGAKLMRRW